MRQMTPDSSPWQPDSEPVTYVVSPRQRVVVGVIMAVCWLVIVVLCVMMLNSVHPDAAAWILVGLLVLTGVFVLVMVMYGRIQVRFSGWQVTSTSGLLPPRTFDARKVHKIRPYRNRASLSWCVWVDDPVSGRERRIIVPTATWGNAGAPAQLLLRLVAHGAPGVDADGYSRRELSALRGR